MNWQVRYAIENFAKPPIGSTAEHIGGDLIRIATPNQPDVLAVITADETIDRSTATGYREQYKCLDFVCGFRPICVWEGGAIQYLKEHGVGWGDFRTLRSAARDGNANTASHRTFEFSDRLLRQHGQVKGVVREFDRIYSVVLKSGTALRIGMIAEYEPTADVIRSLWERFGPVSIAWNINPNGNPTPEAIGAASELGCEVLKWDELKQHLREA